MDIWRWIFPERCPLCGKVHETGVSGICSGCSKGMLVVTEPRCRRCGKPVDSPEQEYCLDCSGRDSVLTQGTALWIYNDSAKRAMADFIYGGCLEDGGYYGRQLAAWCGSQISSWRVDCIVPVPLHWRRRWFRGFNQAEYIARVLGEYLHTPVLNGLKRVRPTRPQKGLNDRQRKDNLKGVFALDERHREAMRDCRSVLLVDDIYTTGATLESCGQVLIEQGLKKIYFACLCIGKDY